MLVVVGSSGSVLLFTAVVGCWLVVVDIAVVDVVLDVGCCCCYPCCCWLLVVVVVDVVVYIAVDDVVVVVDIVVFDIVVGCW